MNIRRILVCTLIFIVILVAAFLRESKTRLTSELIDASYRGNIRKIELRIDQGATVDGRGYDGWTPLSVAAREGHLAAVKALITKGADVNVQEGGGNAPLFWAAFYGHLDVVKFLLASGADKDKRCGDCMPVIDAARKRGHEQIVLILEKSNN